ncbi:MAG: hypothetical protein AAB412_01480 [Elusimicrobiota bacterium]
MAQFFKKRRGPQGPNKNEQKVRRGQEAADRARRNGALSQHHPSVERLSVQLNFLGAQNQPIDQQTRVFGPSDVCDFSVPCPGRCGTGAFDLAAKIQAVVETRQALSESSGLCKVPLFAGSPDACGLQLKCRIEVRYFPQAVEPPLDPAVSAVPAAALSPESAPK